MELKQNQPNETTPTTTHKMKNKKIIANTNQIIDPERSFAMAIPMLQILLKSSFWPVNGD